jgi:integrase
MPKKRAHGDGGLYFIKSRGLWRGVIDIGFNPNGTRKQKSVYGKTQREARDKLDTLKAELKEHGTPLDKTMTVEAWAKHWLETVCRPTLKPGPLRTYESLIRTWVIPTIGKKRVSLLKPSDLRTVSKTITDAGRSSSTALKVHNILSAMLEAARLDGVTGRNIARDVVAPKAAASTRDELAIDDAFRILQAAKKHVDGSRWWFAMLAGMRQGERLGATVDSLNLNRVDPITGHPSPTFTIQWSLTEARFEHGCGGTCGASRGGSCPKRSLILPDGLDYRQLEGRLCIVRPKSNKPRTFPLVPQLEAMLHEYFVDTEEWPNPHGLIWRNPDGSPISATQDNDAWRALLLEAGVITPAQALPPKDRPEGTPPAPTTHWARHTSVTVLRRLGVDARVIGALVGHASTKTTDIYSHVSEADAVAAMKAIGDHFGAVTSGQSSSPT